MNKLFTSIRNINSNKITEWLFYLFTFLLPWQTRWIFKDSMINGEVFEYGRLSLYSFDILIFVIGALWALGCIKVLCKKRPKAIFIILILLWIYSLLSIVWSPNQSVAIYWSIRILEGIILFCLIQKINFSNLRLSIIFVITAVIQSALGIFQFLTQTTFSTKWLGLSSLHASQLGPSVIELQGERWLRAYGAFPHPNILAGFLILAFVFLIYLFFKYYSIRHVETPHQDNSNTDNLLPVHNSSTAVKKSRWGVSADEKQLFFIPVFLYGSLIFITTGIFLSFSRAAWLGLALILAVSVICYYANVLIIKRRGVKIIPNTMDNFNTPSWSFMRPQVASIVIILLLILSIIYLPLVKTRLGIGQPRRLEDKSNIERISSIQQSWQIIKTNPILGVGLGNYTHYLKQQYPDHPAWWYQPVHNIYLLVLAELGIVGFLILVLFNIKLLVRLIKQVISCKSSRITNYQLPITSVCLLFIVYCLFLFDHYFWTNASMWLVVLLIFGLLHKSKSPPN